MELAALMFDYAAGHTSEHADLPGNAESRAQIRLMAEAQQPWAWMLAHSGTAGGAGVIAMSSDVLMMRLFERGVWLRRGRRWRRWSAH